MVYTYTNCLDWMQIMEWRGYLTTYCVKLWANHNTNGYVCPPPPSRVTVLPLVPYNLVEYLLLVVWTPVQAVTATIGHLQRALFLVRRPVAPVAQPSEGPFLSSRQIGSTLLRSALMSRLAPTSRLSPKLCVSRRSRLLSPSTVRLTTQTQPDP
jgi:hypothetical protein